MFISNISFSISFLSQDYVIVQLGYFSIFYKYDFYKHFINIKNNGTDIFKVQVSFS